MVVKVVPGDTTVVEIFEVATGVSGLLVVGGVGCVNLLEVVTVGGLLLGFVVCGRLVGPGICGVVTELVLGGVSLEGTWVLIKTVLMGTVIVPEELGASLIMLVGSDSGVMEVETSACVGNTVLILVELGKVTISVEEGRTENGVVGEEVTSVLGSISIHGGVGEVGTIIMVTVSGQGVEEGREIKEKGVVSVRAVLSEEMVGEMLVVAKEERGEVVTEELMFSVLGTCGEVGPALVVVGSMELLVGEEKGEDKMTVGVEEIKVPKDVMSALVEVLPLVKSSVLDSLEVVREVTSVGVETELLRVDKSPLVIETYVVDVRVLECGDGVKVGREEREESVLTGERVLCTGEEEDPLSEVKIPEGDIDNEVSDVT